MKKTVVLLLAAVCLSFTGCSGNLETLVQDPAFRNYEKEMDAAEKAYLNKEISYAEYLERRREIEEEYARDVQPEREAVSASDPLTDDPMEDSTRDHNETLR